MRIRSSAFPSIVALRTCSLRAVFAVWAVLLAVGWISATSACATSTQSFDGKKIEDKASSSSPQGFLSQVWEENAPVYQKILRSPFNQELVRGTLDERIFREYMLQDYLYLQNFRKTYGLLLAKAPDEAASRKVVQLINGVDKEIEIVHSVFFKKFGVSPQDVETASPLPDTVFYNSFLIKTATLEPFEVGLTAVLPCHWIYAQLSADLGRTEKAPGNKYQEWIDGYDEGAWEESETKRLADFVQGYLERAAPDVREKARQAFGVAMRLELLFWEGIYAGRRWP